LVKDQVHDDNSATKMKSKQINRLRRKRQTQRDTEIVINFNR
jgi:hypothetical protein